MATQSDAWAALARSRSILDQLEARIKRTPQDIDTEDLLTRLNAAEETLQMPLVTVSPHLREVRIRLVQSRRIRATFWIFLIVSIIGSIGAVVCTVLFLFAPCPELQESGQALTGSGQALAKADDHSLRLIIASVAMIGGALLLHTLTWVGIMGMRQRVSRYERRERLLLECEQLRKEELASRDAEMRQRLRHRYERYMDEVMLTDPWMTSNASGH